MSEDLVQITNDALSVQINALGAETHRIRDAAGHDWLWHGDAAWWGGRAPILFPIIGTVVEGHVAYDGDLRPMTKHGFARQAVFDLTDQSATRCTHRLLPDADRRAAFPFEFALHVTHALSGTSLRVSARVENRDTRPMPFGFGFHPAFVWPLPGAGRAPHQIRLDNGAEPALARIDGAGRLLPDHLPSPFEAGVLTLSHDMFGDDAMIFPQGAGAGLTYGPANGPQLRFAFENLPNLALWQKPGAPYLCIEPWHGLNAPLGAGPDMTERPATMVLAAGDVAEFAFTVTFP
jgi:galactose mutarotase-like enzyme